MFQTFFNAVLLCGVGYTLYKKVIQMLKDIDEKYEGKFLTNKILISNGVLYPSEAHLNCNKKLDIVNEVIHDDDAFWKDAEHFYIYDFIIRETIENANSESQERSRELEESERTPI